MKLYMIRWPNGDTSVVGAPTKNEALLFADCEWDDPYGGEICELKRFAIDLKPVIENGRFEFLADTGPFSGDEEFNLLRSTAYPIIEETTENEKFDQLEEAEAEKVLAEALRLEKLRLKARPATKA
ncbi:MAG: hypothetical protein ACK58T_25850, partial [Phycisphaerae bacterium]